jgi:hypothetical protein
MANRKLIYIILFLLTFTFSASLRAQNCYETNIVTPAPFMGNNDEIFKTGDGAVWQVKYAYEYLYEYYPSVVICGESKLIVGGRNISIIRIAQGNSVGKARSTKVNGIKIILKPNGCRDYFLADGDAGGIYLLEWYGGYDPDVGDIIIGNIKSYGFKDVMYINKNMTGRVYVDDYMLSESSAIAKLKEKCR